ncbi:dTDP-4-dehydrorhamnose reductase [Shewanella sp. 10N.261.52.F9]|uniref:dTDP-4-dehydrorhamnose reductase n=1 Tax=Shewanella sp. 10N.261.52.F9 TaxID=3229684 RepID=UPI00354BC24D
MRILITGAGGQLAQALLSVANVAQTNAAQVNVNGLAAAEQLLMGLLPEALDCLLGSDIVKGFCRKQLDISDSHSIACAFDEFEPDVVVNCAAYNAVDLAEIEESTALDINANGPKLLAQACFIRRIKLIHISTDFVFDGELIHPYTEQDVPLPLSVYGGSKLKGESWVNEILGSNAIIIRTSWLYSCKGTNFVKTMQNLFQVKERLSVIDDQRGSPTWCEALAVVIFKLVKQMKAVKAKSHETKAKQFAKALDEDVSASLYHYAAAGTCSWFEFAQYIQRYQEQMLESIQAVENNHSSCSIEPITTELWQSLHRNKLATRPMQSALCAEKVTCKLALDEQSLLKASWQFQLQAMLRHQSAIKLNWTEG